jgi:sugar phosphate isomerase/epimerase
MSKFILSAFADEIDMNWDVQMAVLEQYGINHIEMRGVNGKNISELSLDEAAAIKKQLDARGFKISAFGSPLGKRQYGFQPRPTATTGEGTRRPTDRGVRH